MHILFQRASIQRTISNFEYRYVLFNFAPYVHLWNGAFVNYSTDRFYIYTNKKRNSNITEPRKQLLGRILFVDRVVSLLVIIFDFRYLAPNRIYLVSSSSTVRLREIPSVADAKKRRRQLIRETSTVTSSKKIKKEK